MRVDKPIATQFKLKDCPDVEKIMFMTRSSMAQVVTKAVQEYVTNHKEIVDKYNEVFGDGEYETKFNL